MERFNTDFSQTPSDNLEMFGSTKVEFSKPLLVMEALRICFKTRAQEMRKGYTNDKLNRSGRICSRC